MSGPDAVLFEERPSLRTAGVVLALAAAGLLLLYVPLLLAGELRPRDLLLVPVLALPVLPLVVLPLSVRRFHSVRLTHHELVVGRQSYPTEGLVVLPPGGPPGPVLGGAWAVPLGRDVVVVRLADGSAGRVATRRPLELTAALGVLREGGA